MLMVYQVPEIYFGVEKDVLRNWKLFSCLYKKIKLINVCFIDTTAAIFSKC
jgi:hypothetical protein